ncbi:MFS transporter [Clostridium sp. UBA4548]|uniref:MFS transporter n=1 Tax=Clostridium sp. UBA4548 TaxID=1946361 RepID=UPI0025C0F883|nr:MFS transporter [Clostridium sp. UBA4548]
MIFNGPNTRFRRLLNVIRRFNKKRNHNLEQNNIYYYTLNGILFTIVNELYKTFATKFIFRLGGTESHVALYNALPGLVAVLATIPGLILISKIQNKKQSMSRAFYFSRIFLLLFAIVPFLPSSIKPLTFVILISLMNFPESVSVTSLQSYVGDIFSQDTIPVAITTRSKYSTIAQIIFTFIIGQTLGLMSNIFTESTVIIVYQLFFILAFIVGLVEINTFKKLTEITETLQNKIEFKKVFKEIKSTKPFINFLICSVIFHFGWQMGWPMFSIYQIKYLGANETWLTIINIASAVVMIYSYGYWRKIIQKRGNAFAMAVATLGMALTPILYVISNNLITMTIVSTITGFFTPGTVTVLLNSLLEVSPSKNRAVFIGFHTTIVSISLCIAPLVGDVILSNTNIKYTLVVVAILRLIGSIAFFIRNRYFKYNIAN